MTRRLRVIAHWEPKAAVVEAFGIGFFEAYPTDLVVIDRATELLKDYSVSATAKILRVEFLHLTRR